MEILIVTQYFWPENFRINDLCSALALKGHKVTVLTGYPNYPEGKIYPEFNIKSEKFSSYMGVEIVRVPLFPRGKSNICLALNYLSFLVSATALGPFKLRQRNFDIVFACQLSPVFIGISAAVLARLKCAPLVMWVLDLWPETLQAVGIIKSNWMLRMMSSIVSTIYGNCDLILAQSKSFIPKIHNLNPNKNTSIEYLPSWPEALFNTQSDFFAPEISKDKEYFNVVFAGNIGAAQDFPCILKAAEILKKRDHIRFLIIGDGSAASSVADEVNRLDLGERFLMLGKYPIDRMPEFFRHADALLVTLTDTPVFGMTIPGKLQAYLAAGIPIVAAINGEGSSLIKRSGAGMVVQAGDGAALADAILSISLMPKSERIAMGEAGKRLSNQEFNRGVLIDKIESMLVSEASNTINKS